MTTEEYHELVDFVSEDAERLVQEARKRVKWEFEKGERKGVLLHKISNRAALAEFCLANFLSIEAFETLCELMELDF